MNNQPFESVRDVISNMAGYLPTFLAGLLVVAVGAIISWIVAKLIVRILVFLRLDRVVVRLGWGRALEKGDVRHSLFGLVGWVCGVLLFLVFLENAIVIWKLTVLSQLVEKLVLLIPQLITAAIIVMAGWGIATSVSRSVQRTLYQEEFERARLAGRVTFGAIIVLASAIALVELEIAREIVIGGFLIAFGALGLSFVFAVGLGSKRAVELMWDNRFRAGKQEREKENEDSEKE
jgi:hypothetical protein